MAEVAVAAADAEEKYLYGEISDTANAAEGTVKDAKSANGSNTSADMSKVKKEQDEEDEDGEFEESDDDDDDNIQVHIGEVNTAPGPYGTPVNWKKDAVAVTASKLATLPTQGQKKIDVNAVGLINGQPIYEYDLDVEQDEKPWRKPGADISDYFNYGFTEDTWKQYCEKQKRMRMESQRGPYTVTQANHPNMSDAQVEIEVLPDGRTRIKAGPPPDRKVEGSIHVLGSNADARRKQKEDELLALALGSTNVMAPFPGQRPMYTALPGGAVVYNPMPGQPMMPPPTSQPGADMQSQSSGNITETSQTSSQVQQIQSLGAPPVMTTVVPSGLQFIGPGGPAIPGLQQIIGPGGAQMFQQGPMGLEFTQQDPFMHPGAMLPPMGGSNYGQFAQSDSDFDSDGENRRHKSRRESGRHRRHRDRGDRERGDRDRERDRPIKRERERSVVRRSRDHSKAPSERKSKHSSRSASSVRTENDDGTERKVRSSRRSKKEPADTVVAVASEEEVKTELIEVKQEPTGD